MKIQVGDLVKFKYDMFDERGVVHLVTSTIYRPEVGSSSAIIKLHSGSDIHHRARNFIVISKAKS